MMKQTACLFLGRRGGRPVVCLVRIGRKLRTQAMMRRGYRGPIHAKASAQPGRALWRACGGLLTLLVGATGLVGAGPVEGRSRENRYPELRDLIGPQAEVTTTQHFVVAYDTPAETVHQLTSRLEATYIGIEKFCTFNKVTFKRPEGPLEALLFDQPEDFYRHAAGLGLDAHGLNGFYHPGTKRSAFFNILNHPALHEVHERIAELEKQVAELKGRDLNAQERALKDKVVDQWHFSRKRRDRLVEKLNRSVVQHEAAHQVLFEAGVHVKGAPTPAWLAEGLACLFETPPSSHGSGLGTTNQMRLADFRAACGEVLESGNPRPRKMKPESLQQAYPSGRFIPLRRFLGLAELSDTPGDPKVAYYYAEAWGLAFYLQREHRRKLAQYLSSVAQREPGQERTPEQEMAEFEAVFGPVDERFERRWATFILSLSFTPEFVD